MPTATKKHSPERQRYQDKRAQSIHLVRNGSTFAEAATEVGAATEAVRNWCRTERVSLTPEARDRTRRRLNEPPPESPTVRVRNLFERRAKEYRRDLTDAELLTMVAGELELTVNEVREALS